MVKVLMLVATSVATDTRVLREAKTLVDFGYQVHIIGRSIPIDFVPPTGITVSSVGTSSVFRAEGGASLAGRRLSPPVRLARWLLLPQHRRSAFGRWAAGALELARGLDFDIVHAHDFTALAPGATLAEECGVPLIYDSHEFWSGIPREHRPTPLADWLDRRQESRLGGRAAAVITVGDGVAEALRSRYGWDNIVVVRNTFPLAEPPPEVPSRPAALVYAGRISAFRELETIAAASRQVDVPITLCGPADETWLSSFDCGRVTVLGALPLEEASKQLASAGIALVTHSGQWLNHRLALPNKLFHAVSLGLPVVATDVDELARVVRKYDLGPLYRPGDAASLAVAINQAVHDFARYACNVEAARSALSWEADGARLQSVYREVALGLAAGLGEG